MKTQYEAAQERFHPDIPWKPEYAMQHTAIMEHIDALTREITKERGNGVIAPQATVKRKPWSLTPFLWAACALCGIIGSYVMYRGGWSHVVACPFPIQLVREVWHTNEVYANDNKDNTVWMTNNFRESDVTNVSSWPGKIVWTNDLIIGSNRIYYNTPLIVTNSYLTNFYTTWYTNNVSQ